jgi:hypothetical protein
VLRDGQEKAAQVQAERTEMKACVHEEGRHGMCGGWLAVDGGDEHTLVAIGLHALLPARSEKMRKAFRGLRALWLV